MVDKVQLEVSPFQFLASSSGPKYISSSFSNQIIFFPVSFLN